MLRLFKSLLLGGLLVSAALPAGAFSLLGLTDGRFQTPALGYDPVGAGNPMNIGEEYRWTVPVITYAFDESFINYFGTAGIAAIDAAFQVFNDLPPVDSITTNPVAGDPNLYYQGNPFPIQTVANNFQAGTLGLLDIKSYTMSQIAQYLGLAHAENWVWCLRDRSTFNNGANTNYAVIKRNFDPITWEPTNSVNSAVYSYSIFDGLPGSDAIENLVADPLSTGGFSTVAGGIVTAGRLGLFGNLALGRYYTGLTRDDVAGLRYLLRFDNYNLEALRAGYTNVPISSPYLPAGGTTNLTNSAIINALRPGIGKITFRRINFDSLINIPGVNPYTNTYTDHFFTNNTLKSQTLRQIAFVPDLLIAASDLGNVIAPGGQILGPNGSQYPAVAAGLYQNSRQNPLLYPGPVNVGGLPGPGTIGQDLNATGSGQFVYNKVGPTLINRTPAFLTELTALQTFVWGSFDGSANPPIAYPNGASIQQLEQQLFLNR